MSGINLPPTFSAWFLKRNTYFVPFYQGQKNSLVSGNRPGEILSFTRPHSGMCIGIYTSNFKKQTGKKDTKKQKKLKKKKSISPENGLQKINLQLPGWRFFLSPAFPEVRVFFWPNLPSLIVWLLRYWTICVL